MDMMNCVVECMNGQRMLVPLTAYTTVKEVMDGLAVALALTSYLRRSELALYFQDPLAQPELRYDNLILLEEDFYMGDILSQYEIAIRFTGEKNTLHENPLPTLVLKTLVFLPPLVTRELLCNSMPAWSPENGDDGDNINMDGTHRNHHLMSAAAAAAAGYLGHHSSHHNALRKHQAPILVHDKEIGNAAASSSSAQAIGGGSGGVNGHSGGDPSLVLDSTISPHGIHHPTHIRSIEELADFQHQYSSRERPKLLPAEMKLLLAGYAAAAVVGDAVPSPSSGGHGQGVGGGICGRPLSPFSPFPSSRTTGLGGGHYFPEAYTVEHLMKPFFLETVDIQPVDRPSFQHHQQNYSHLHHHHHHQQQQPHEFSDPAERNQLLSMGELRWRAIHAGCSYVEKRFMCFQVRVS